MDDSFASSGSEAPPPYLGAGQSPGISERMQALMSRAEQEIAEQRQLQALVEEVRHSLAQLQDEMRQAAGAHTLEIVRGEVTGLAAEVRGSTTSLGERVEAVVRAVGASAQVMQNVVQQLDRVTELVTRQQEELGALSAAVARAAEPDAEVRAHVSGVRDDVGGVREHVGALRERLDDVAGEVKADSAASLRALADRIDSAVIALAEALLRPRGGGPAPDEPPATAAAADDDDEDDDEELPTTATMTVPVVAPPPWTGASDDDEDEEVAPAAPHADEDVLYEDAIETPPEPQAVDEGVENAVPLAEADEAEDEDEDEEDDEPEVVAPVVAAEEPEDDGGEVPLDAWSVDAPPESPPPSAWDWEEVREHGGETDPHGEQSEKRRPWWRPGG